MKFLTETFHRIFKSSPSYFQVIQWLSIAVAFVSGIPLLISQFQTDLGIMLPDWVHDLSSKAVLWSSVVAWIIAKLPVKTVQDDKMPFTTKKPNETKTNGTLRGLLFFMLVGTIAFSCQVKFVPTKSSTALASILKIQQDATNTFTTAEYNQSMYSDVNEQIDSLIAFDKRRAKAGTIVKQDLIIQKLFTNYQNEHEKVGIIGPTALPVYKSYFKSAIDARLVSENSLK